MSDETTPSNDTSTSTQSYSGQPFKTATSRESVTIAEQPAPPNEVTIGVTATPANPDLDAYRAEKGAPYANEYFELGTPYDYLPPEMQDKLTAIDEYVDLELADHGWKHNLSNYNRVVEGLKSEMIAGQELSLNDMIDRLAGFARNMVKMNGIDDVKRDLTRQLKRLSRGKDMDNAVLKAIGKKIV